MPIITVEIYLSPQQLLQYYSGVVHTVIAPSLTGQSVQLPLAGLRQYIKEDGIRGLFDICYSAQGKLISIVPAKSSSIEQNHRPKSE